MLLRAQLHVRPDGLHGGHRAVHLALSLPLRHRVQLHRRCSPHCHVEERRQEPEVRVPLGVKYFRVKEVPFNGPALDLILNS